MAIRGTLSEVVSSVRRSRTFGSNSRGHHSVLTSFYYGNLTNPSVDPPRIGLVSTMPSNAKDLLASAIKAAGSNFPGTW